MGAIVLRTHFASGWIVAIGAGSALLFAHFLSASAEENRTRRELIDALERTRAELAAAERRAGIDEERQRIGRELHDTVTQQLVGIVMQLDDASARVRAADDRSVHDAIERSRELARAGLADARRLVWSERPRELEAGSLTGALNEALDAIAADGVEAERVLEGDLDALPPGVQTLVFRGVQEALANVRKHARARRVSVTALALDDRLLVDVQDDGVGFDADRGAGARDDGSGFGLRGLRERVEILGGSLAVESEKGSGTTIGFQVPLSS
jgi:signal transduction histidine kinase